MRGYFGVGVDGISKPMNLGNLVRIAHAFDASFFFSVAPRLNLSKANSDTSNAEGQLPFYSFDKPDDFRLPLGCRLTGLNDSKQLCENKRNELDVVVRAKALAFAIAAVDVETIDRINIRRASLLAMRIAKQAKLDSELEQVPQESSALSSDQFPFVAQYIRADGGSRWSEAAVTAFARFAERSGLPVGTSFRRSHLFPADHPNYVGDVGIGHQVLDADQEIGARPELHRTLLRALFQTDRAESADEGDDDDLGHRGFVLIEQVPEVHAGSRRQA